LFDNDESTACKEAMMGPNSVKWLEAIKSVIVPYTRNQVSELGRPTKGMKPNESIWIYKQTWMFCIYEVVDTLLKEFMIVFKELIVTRFDLS
jgi:hypothetical protein